MTTNKLRLIVLAIVFLKFAEPGRACSCIGITPQEGARLSDIVFKGELVGHRRNAAVFRVDEQWKGNLESFVEVEWRRGDGGDCDGFWPKDLKIGNELLVFATKGSDGIYRTSICLPTRLAAEALMDFHDLGPGKPPQFMRAESNWTSKNAVSFVLLAPPLVLTIAAWLMWMRLDINAAVQASRWRRIAITSGLAFLSADMILSAGYLLYVFSFREARWSVFDTCSSVGAISCLIAIIGGVVGKGAATRLLLVFDSIGGMLFWYLTIGPSS